MIYLARITIKAWNFQKQQLIYQQIQIKVISFLFLYQFKLYQRNMVKKQTKSKISAPFEVNPQFAVQAHRNYKFQDQYYFEDSITEKKALYPQAPSQNGRIQEKKIKKQRKVKKHNSDDRFLKEHEKKYYLFPFIYSSQNAFLKISWAQWKPNSVYKKMAATLSSCPLIPGKTPIQCKSYDQRMKQEHFIKRSLDQKEDLFESALSYLQKTDLSIKDVEIVEGYLSKMGQKSSYMLFLDQMVQVEEIDLERGKFELEIKREEANLTEESKENEILFNEFFDQF